MKVIYASVEFMVSFIEMFLMYRFYSATLFKYRKRGGIKYELVLTLIGTVLIDICNSFSIFSYFTMALFALFTSVSATVLYKINYFVVFSMSCFYVLCLGCIDFLIFSLASIFYNGSKTFGELVMQPSPLRAVTIIGIKCIWILIYLVVRKYLHRVFSNKYYAYTLLIVTFSGFLGFAYMVNQTFRNFNNSIPNIWILFVLCLIFAVLLIFFAFEIKEEKMKLNFSEVRNNLLEENYRTINDIYMKNAKVYHDLNNHMNVLYHLLDQQEIEKAKDYIKEIAHPITQLSKTTWTGIDVIDVIINSKMEKAKEIDAAIELNVEFPQNTNIQPHDICTILSNLLDNAIEAAGKVTGKRKITLIIRRINHFVMIKIINSCVGSVENKNKFPATTKDNKQLHGWGLPSVKETVDKYNGTIKYANEHGEFIVSIMLFYDIQ